MRKGIAGLSALARDVLRQKPASGAVFAFRGRRGDRLKLPCRDGPGFCLYCKGLERGRFPWPDTEAGGAPDLRTACHAAGGDPTGGVRTGARRRCAWGIYPAESACFIGHSGCRMISVGLSG